MTAPPWTATVLTLYPEMFPGPLGISLAGKALASGLWRLETRDIRDAASDRHRSVDDTPAGGGAGMVMRADILARAIDTALASSERATQNPLASSERAIDTALASSERATQNPLASRNYATQNPRVSSDDASHPPPARPRLLMSPRGAPLTQARVRDLVAGPGPLIVCGRFEGIDERVIVARDLEEVSLGDIVLSGGEIAAMALIDACVRLIPGVMGRAASGEEESFADGLLEYPHYTRPQLFEGRPIPEVLSSGDHARIAAWRRAEAEALTRRRRPDLWQAYQTTRPAGPPPGRPKRPKSTTDG